MRWRGKVYVGEEAAPGPGGHSYHMDAINKAFANLGEVGKRKAYDRISDGHETMEFGYAQLDGSDFVLSDSQAGRKLMYFP